MNLSTLFWLFSSCLHPQEVGRLDFEDRLGNQTEVSVADLPLSDPRKRQGWFVRPVGGEERQAPMGPADSLRVRLAGGDELLGRVVGGAGEDLLLELVGGVCLPVPVERIEAIWPAAREGQGEERPEEGDRLYRLAGGGLDRVDGTLEAFTTEGIRFSSRLGEREFPWPEVAALFVEVLEAPPRGTSSETEVVLDLNDGSRFRCGLARLEVSGCRVIVVGSEILIPWKAVGELVVNDGSLVHLSDLVPRGEEGRGTPFGDDLGMVFEHTLDRSVVGGALRVGGETWRRGIGTHAPTRLIYDLDGGFTKLRGSVGIDDSSLANPENARGSVVFRVHVDGKTAWESRVVRGGDAPVDLPILDLTGAREVVLEADPVEDFRGDRADWLRILLVR